MFYPFLRKYNLRHNNSDFTPASAYAYCQITHFEIILNYIIILKKERAEHSSSVFSHYY